MLLFLIHQQLQRRAKNLLLQLQPISSKKMNTHHSQSPLVSIVCAPWIQEEEEEEEDAISMPKTKNSLQFAFKTFCEEGIIR
jgi:hypothetical protein